MPFKEGDLVVMVDSEYSGYYGPDLSEHIDLKTVFIIENVGVSIDDYTTYEDDDGNIVDGDPAPDYTIRRVDGKPITPGGSKFQSEMRDYDLRLFNKPLETLEDLEALYAV